MEKLPHASVVYDIETYIDKENAEKIYSTRKYEPNAKLSPINKPPKTITDTKDDDKRKAKLEKWEIDQAGKIQASIDEQKNKAKNKAALHWTTGKVVSIVAIIDEDTKFMKCGQDEAEILQGFSDFLHENDPQNVIGKSNRIFDDGFVIGRMMVNRIKIPFCIRSVSPLAVKDINDIFGFGRSHPQHAKLNDYSITLGFGEKLAEGGSVAAMVDAGEYKKLLEYNMQDTVLTADIYRLYCDLCK